MPATATPIAPLILAAVCQTTKYTGMSTAPARASSFNTTTWDAVCAADIDTSLNICPSFLQTPTPGRQIKTILVRAASKPFRYMTQQKACNTLSKFVVARPHYCFKKQINIKLNCTRCLNRWDHRLIAFYLPWCPCPTIPINYPDRV